MNARFADYVTSGAFNMTLTRSQIADLSMMAAGVETFSNGALERKGLAEPIASEGANGLQYRLTGAGALMCEVLHQAGLTNGGNDTRTAEIDRLRSELDAARQRAADCSKRAWTVAARLAEAEIERDEANYQTEAMRSLYEAAQIGIRIRSRPADASFVVRPRDQHPGVPTDEVLAGLEAAE